MHYLYQSQRVLERTLIEDGKASTVGKASNAPGYRV
jgi:hypothetical protein